jgi:hypothetical protein
MTTHENIPTQDPAAANRLQPPAEVGLAATVGDLLRSEEIARLPEGEQGAVIVDRFIGHLAAIKSVEGSNGDSKDTVLLLGEIDAIGRKSGDDWIKGLSTLTKNEGLRHAVFLLGSDSRSGQHVSSMSEHVSVKNGNLTLGSIDQVRGYLDNHHVNGIADGTNWRAVISSEAHMHAMGERQGPLRSDPRSRDLLKSDVPMVRTEQQEWERAANTAHAAGVDMELIDRSTLEMQRRHDEGVYIGQQALSGAIVQNFDHLFE